jgi:hypothetical protein
MDPVPDPLLLKKSGSARNRTQDVWICSQELRPMGHIGGPAKCLLLHTKIPTSFKKEKKYMYKLLIVILRVKRYIQKQWGDRYDRIRCS